MSPRDEDLDRDRVLDGNLERLMAIAPEPATLDDGARERMRAALRERAADLRQERDEPRPAPASTPNSPPASPPASAPAARRLAIVLAAAAAILLVVLGVRALDGGRALDVDVAQGGNDVDRGDRTDVIGGAEDGTSVGTDGGSGVELEPVATTDDGEGRRTAENTSDDEARAAAAAAAALAGEEARGNGGLEGRLTLGDGVTALPATVRVWVKPMVDLPRVADPRGHDVPIVLAADSAASGTFVVSGALRTAMAFGTSEVLVQLEADGAAPARLVVDFDEIRAGAVAFELTPGVSLQGFVTDERTGTPVAGAVVAVADQLPMDGLPAAPSADDDLPEPVTMTDANGAFVLEHVALEPKVQVRASAVGFAATTVDVRLGGRSNEPVQLALKQGGAVKGVVERSDGTRWANALVVASAQVVEPTARVRPPMTFGLGFTDAAGSYRIEDLPAGPYVVLLIGDPSTRQDGPKGFQQAQLAGTEEVTIDFLAQGSADGPSFDGTLRLRDGSPATGVTLTLMGVDAGTTSRTDWRATETDEDGRFVFADIERGSYVLHRATKSFRRMELVWSGTIDGPIERDITLPPGDWTIVCRGERDREPRPGSWVFLELESRDLGGWIYAGLSQADEAGAAHFPELPPGRYRAVVSGLGEESGHRMLEPIDLLPGVPTTTVAEVPDGSSLWVRVVDAASGEPIEDARVQVRDANNLVVPQPDTPKTDPRGLARSFSVTYGVVDVIVRTDEYPERVVELEFGPGSPGTADEPLEVALDRGASDGD
ncbi:MAG: carboxypeptidase regulatory-like domain-containing protein [Planctomycetota bacterium]